LAQVGAERIAEIENPELAQARIRETYKAKGYSDSWIEKRIRGILVRDELTSEWKNRGVKEGKEYFLMIVIFLAINGRLSKTKFPHNETIFTIPTPISN